jgi:hypothetical protein
MPCYAHNDIGLMTISRAGTASVQAACPWPQVSLAEYADIPNRVAFLREPHARMEASYGLHLERSFDLPLESFADFVSRFARFGRPTRTSSASSANATTGAHSCRPALSNGTLKSLPSCLGSGPSRT